MLPLKPARAIILQRRQIDRIAALPRLAELAGARGTINNVLTLLFWTGLHTNEQAGESRTEVLASLLTVAFCPAQCCVHTERLPDSSAPQPVLLPQVLSK